MGYFVIIVIGLIVTLWLFARLKQEQERRERRERGGAYGIRVLLGDWEEPRGTAPLEWLGQNQLLTVGGYRISKPLTYCSDGAPVEEEPSCIDRSLRIGTPVDEPSGMLGYWPSYSRITPDQRANYLAWFSEGRRGPLSDIGYAFIFFYGLERRVLVEEEDIREVLAETTRLLNVYTFSASFNGYLGRFLAYVVAKIGVEKLAERSFQYIFHESLKKLDESILSVMLAWYYTHERPLPLNVVLAIAEADVRTPRSVVPKRVPELFHELFEKRYVARFGDGMKLKVSARERLVDYTPASGALAGHTFGAEHLIPRVRIPNVLGIQSQFKPLVTMYGECLDDLRKLSTKVAKGIDVGSRDAYDLLPAALREDVEHPDQPLWQELIEGHMQEDGRVLVPVSELAPLIGVERKPRLTKAQGEKLAATANEVGFNIVPDTRATWRTYAWDEQVSLLRPEADPSVPGKEYAAAAMMLELGMAVAAADGSIDPEEMEHVESFLEGRFSLGQDDAQRLEALRDIMVSQPPSGTRLGKRLKGVLSSEQREVVARFLVGVTAADNVLDPKERTVLRRLYKALDVDTAKLDELLASAVAAPGEPVEVRGAIPATRPGEAIPARREPGADVPVTLDPRLVRRILAETEQVAQILSVAMATDDESEADETALAAAVHEPAGEAEEPAATESASKASDDRFPGLDARYAAVLKALLQQRQWTREQFERVVREHGLMPAGVVDVVNTWADEELGDFIIEEGDPLVINTELTGE